MMNSKIMRNVSSRLALLGLIVSCLADFTIHSAAAQSPRLKLPEGFSASLFASDEQASNIQCMATNSAGQIVVSGPGYIRVLEDGDKDGIADIVHQFADGPQSGAQGMCVAGSSYYVIGDQGLLHYEDADADAVADAAPKMLKAFRTGGEHFTHAIRKGPDGYWYIIVGNEGAINATSITALHSPIRTPQAGTLLRISPDFQTTEVLTDGYRNAYDFDFNAQGDLFVYDSDGERELSLPTYRPTRVFHSVPGMNHGWVTRSWKKPNYFAKMSPTIAELGRGSPTGVVSYRHDHFPPEFRNTLFVLDWTYGRVVAVKMKRQGASWLAKERLFAEAEGDFGFAPTDAVVGPDGALYISVGGRGIQGGVFRITYQGPSDSASAPQVESVSEQRSVDDVLAARQPLAAWSRARWEPAAQQLNEEAFLIAALNRERDPAERIRALEILTELFQGPDIDLMKTILSEEDRELRARAVWAYGRSVGGQLDKSVMRQALSDPSPVVVRRALEALLTCTADSLPGLENEIAIQLGNADRVVKQLAVLVASRLENESFRIVGEVARKTGWPEALQMARSFVERGYVGHPYAWSDIGVEALRRNTDPEQVLSAVLLIQHSLGGFGDSPVHTPLFDGYKARLPLPNQPERLAVLASIMENQFPTGDPVIDTEMARLAAMIAADSPRLLEKLIAQITSESSFVDDLHHLACIACLPSSRTKQQTTAIGSALLNLFVKIEQENAVVDRNWQPRVTELFEQLTIRDPELPAVLVELPQFGLPEHAMFVDAVTGQPRQTAIINFLTNIQNQQLELTPEIMTLLVGLNSPQSLRIARESLDDESLSAAAILLLADANDPADRQTIRTGLGSSNWDVVRTSLDAVADWNESSPAILAALNELLQRLADEKEFDGLWTRTLTQLQRHTALHKNPTTPDDPTSAGPLDQIARTEDRREIASAWQTWLTAQFPDADFESTAQNPSVEWSAWAERLATIDWDAGDPTNGQIVFTQRQCGQCHQGRTTVGPSLSGITQRFSRPDLLRSIVDPHRDVSPRYRSTMITTNAGKIYTGIVIYESIDGLLLRDSTHRTIRIETQEIEFRKKLDSSLMPENLFKQASDAEIADLFAYLQSLSKN